MTIHTVIGDGHVSIRRTPLFVTEPVCVTLVVAVYLSLGSGCVSPFTAHPAGMVPHDLSIQRPIGESACITITEADAFQNVLTREAFTGEAFAKATDLTLTQTGVFRQIVSCSERPGFRLKITIVHLGFELGYSVFHKTSASIAVYWQLFGAHDDKPLWQEQIVSTCSVCKLPADPRTRQATEQVCRENIKKAVLQLSKLSLPASPAP